MALKFGEYFGSIPTLLKKHNTYQSLTFNKNIGVLKFGNLSHFVITNDVANVALASKYILKNVFRVIDAFIKVDGTRFIVESGDEAYPDEFKSILEMNTDDLNTEGTYTITGTLVYDNALNLWQVEELYDGFTLIYNFVFKKNKYFTLQYEVSNAVKETVQTLFEEYVGASYMTYNLGNTDLTLQVNNQPAIAFDVPPVEYQSSLDVSFYSFDSVADFQASPNAQDVIDTYIALMAQAFGVDPSTISVQLVDGSVIFKTTFKVPSESITKTIDQSFGNSITVKDIFTTQTISAINSNNDPSITQNVMDFFFRNGESTALSHTIPPEITDPNTNYLTYDTTLEVVVPDQTGENPLDVGGYYPLFTTEEEANTNSQDNTSNPVVIDGTTYYQPNVNDENRTPNEESESQGEGDDDSGGDTTGLTNMINTAMVSYTYEDESAFETEGGTGSPANLTFGSDADGDYLLPKSSTYDDDTYQLHSVGLKASNFSSEMNSIVVRFKVENLQDGPMTIIRIPVSSGGHINVALNISGTNRSFNLQVPTTGVQILNANDWFEEGKVYLAHIRMYTFSNPRLYLAIMDDTGVRGELQAQNYSTFENNATEFIHYGVPSTRSDLKIYNTLFFSTLYEPQEIYDLLYPPPPPPSPPATPSDTADLTTLVSNATVAYTYSNASEGPEVNPYYTSNLGTSGSETGFTFGNDADGNYMIPKSSVHDDSTVENVGLKVYNFTAQGKSVVVRFKIENIQLVNKDLTLFYIPSGSSAYHLTFKAMMAGTTLYKGFNMSVPSYGGTSIGFADWVEEGKVYYAHMRFTQHFNLAILDETGVKGETNLVGNYTSFTNATSQFINYGHQSDTTDIKIYDTMFFSSFYSPDAIYKMLYDPPVYHTQPIVVNNTNGGTETELYPLTFTETDITFLESTTVPLGQHFYLYVPDDNNVLKVPRAWIKNHTLDRWMNIGNQASRRGRSAEWEWDVGHIISLGPQNNDYKRFYFTITNVQG